MEYLHASLILHATGKKITEKAIDDILTAAGVEPDKNRIKGLIAALSDINIDEALKNATIMPTVSAAPTSTPAASTGTPAATAAPKKEEEKEEEEESGLSSLFG